MKHKYKVYHFENEKLVSEWEEEEIDPILYLNNYYNFLDTDTFESGYSNGKGSKDYVYEVLKKHLEALKIIIGYVLEVKINTINTSPVMIQKKVMNFGGDYHNGLRINII